MEGVCLLIVEQLLKENWELGIDNNCIMCDFWKKKKQLYNLWKMVTPTIMLIVEGTMNCDLSLFGVCSYLL